MADGKLSNDSVQQLMRYCLFQEGEPTDNAVKVHGIVSQFGFHPGRLAEKTAEIIELLNELPEEFQHDKGGGMSFMMACNDRDGKQWTGSHQTMDELFCLGLAIGKVDFCMPRELWDSLPGGVAYLVINR